MALVPIVIHSQNMDCVLAIENYFETKFVKSVMSDGKNLYVEFNKINKNKYSDKLREFVSILEEEIPFVYGDKSFKITTQYYDL